MSTDQLRVLTLNCWGFRHLSVHLHERMNALVFELAQSEYDIIALQAVWVKSDYELIRSRAERRYPYAIFFDNEILGSGLVFLSRYPIVDANMHPHSVAGRPFELDSKEFLQGKGVASIVIQHPILKEIEFFNAHMPSKQGHRLVASWELSKLLRASASQKRHVLTAGDFNSLASSLEQRTIREYAGVRDAWEEVHAKDADIPRSSDAKSAVTVNGVTCRSPLMPYTNVAELDEETRKNFGKRIDFILYRGPADASNEFALAPKEANVVFHENVPGYNYSFSNHFGVETIFDIVESAEPSLKEPVGDRYAELSLALVKAVTDILCEASKISEKQMKVAGASAAGVLGLVAFSTLFPGHFGPAITLLGAGLGVLCAIYACSGYLYGNVEKAALTRTLGELKYLKLSESQ